MLDSAIHLIINTETLYPPTRSATDWMMDPNKNAL